MDGRRKNYGIIKKLLFYNLMSRGMDERMEG
jgi:hypothetical protein